MSRKKEFCDEVTNYIISNLEKGVSPWKKPWISLRPHNPVSGAVYKGANFLILAAFGARYRSSGWMTFKQATALGGSVTGQKSVRCHKWTILEKTDPATGEKQEIPYMSSFNVFNLDQISDLPEKYTQAPRELEDHTEESLANLMIDACMACGATIEEGALQSRYSPSADVIQIPSRKKFDSDAAFASRLAHSLIYWSLHPSRLDGNLSTDESSEEFGHQALIAELGASFLSSAFGLSSDLQHAEYISMWLASLRENNYLIFKLAQKAQIAFDYLLSLPEIKSRVLATETFEAEELEEELT